MAAQKKSATKAKGTPVRKKTTAKRAKIAKPATRKTATRKTTAKATKRTTAKRAVKSTDETPKAAKRSLGPVQVGRKPYTKSQFIATICDQTGLARKDVIAVLETIPHIISAHVQKQGPELFSWPGMFKIQVIKKPATKARQGINPFTGESMLFKAKPASRRVKIRPLKQLKEMAA